MHNFKKRGSLSFGARDKQKQRVCFAVLNLYVSITLMLIVKSYSLLHLCPKPLMMASRSAGIIEESAGQAIISDFHFLLVFGLQTELCINAYQNIYRTLEKQASSLLTSDHKFSKHLAFGHSINKASG